MKMTKNYHSLQLNKRLVNKKRMGENNVNKTME